MKVLILGGSGFVGTRLTKILLDDHYDVAIGDLAASPAYPELWTKCDVCDESELRPLCKGVDVVINLAAAHRDDVRPLSLYSRTNVEGAETLCRVTAECGIRRIVFTSSVAVFGFPKYEYDEDAPKVPFNEYGRTKLLAEEVYRQWKKASPENQLHIIRPTVIFGEGNRGNIYNLFHQLSTGKFLMIGSGKNKKSMAYVGNIAAFLKWTIENNYEPYSVYDYIDKPDMDMNDLIALFEKVVGHKVHPALRLPLWLGLAGGFCFDVLGLILRKHFVISTIRIRKFCAQTIFSSDKMQKSGFVPPFSIHDALERTIQYEFVDNAEAGNNREP